MKLTTFELRTPSNPQKKMVYSYAYHEHHFAVK